MSQREAGLGLRRVTRGSAWAFAWAVCGLALTSLPAHADLVLETETAELGHKGDSLVSSAVQFEKEKDGSTTTFTLNQFEYALSPRLSVYAEAFANTSPALGQRGTFSTAIATEYHIKKRLNAFVSTGYDSDHLFNVRPGFNIEF